MPRPRRQVVLPSYRSETSQLQFFETKLVTPGRVRNYCGDFFEHVTAAVSAGKRHITDSRIKYCPDISLPESRFLFEVKSIGRTRSAIIYDQRLEKDIAFAKRTGVKVFYWLWCHRFAADSETTSRSVLHQGLASSLQKVLVLELDRLAPVCFAKPPRILNTGRSPEYHQGYGKYGYKTGWCVPVSKFLPLCTTESELPATSISYNGETFALPSVPVFATVNPILLSLFI